MAFFGLFYGTRNTSFLEVYILLEIAGIEMLFLSKSELFAYALFCMAFFNFFEVFAYSFAC
jgi:hypothetical protein